MASEDLVRVVFTKHHAPYNSGEGGAFTAKQALKLTRLGMAVYADQEPAPALATTAEDKARATLGDVTVTREQSAGRKKSSKKTRRRGSSK